MKKYLVSLILLITMLFNLSSIVYATPVEDLYGLKPNVQEEEKEQKNTKVSVEGNKTTYDITSSMATSSIKLIIDDKKIDFPDQQPIVLNDRTYIPVRFLAEALGAEVEWDQEHQVVIINNKGLQITEENGFKVRYYLKINQAQMVYVKYNNGFAVDVHVFDIPERPIIMGSRTMLPFRFVAELLGAYVYYDDVNHAAICLTKTSITDVIGNKQKMPLGLNAVLTTVMQDAFQKELGVYRNVQVGKKPLKTNDELMASAGWKVYDMVSTDHYDSVKHSNSDGTYSGTRFFTLYKPTKYPNGLPSPVTELIKAANSISQKPFQILFRSSESLKNDYYYDFNTFSIEKMLDDAEYWYEFLRNDWGINLHKLDTQSNLLINGYNLNKYKMSSTARFNEYPLHAAHVITHWNKAEYERYARVNIHGWEISKKHKEGILSTSIYMGFAIQIINSVAGGNNYSRGYSALHISQWDYFN